MTPKQVNLKIDPYTLLIEAAKLRTSDQIKERRAATGCSVAEAMRDILNENGAASFLALWKREAEAAMRGAASAA